MHPKLAQAGKVCYNSNITIFYRPMKSSTETPQNLISISIRPPYGKEASLYLSSIMEVGLKTLKDTGWNVNYEEFCQIAREWVGNQIFAPEWKSYWKYWEARFKAKHAKTQRKEIFRELISDMVEKWFITSPVNWLTANYSSIVENILRTNKKPTVL